MAEVNEKRIADESKVEYSKYKVSNQRLMTLSLYVVPYIDFTDLIASINNLLLCWATVFRFFCLFTIRLQK